MWAVLAIAIVGTLCSVPAVAQFRGTLQGTVTDNQGGVIPNAKVSLTNTDTNQTQTTTTNGEGIYNFGALGPAHYRLVVEAANFQTKTLENVQIIPEQPNSINVALAVAAATQTVTVDASQTPLLDTETATVQGTISSNQIEHMPSFGRDVFQMTNLAPGTTGDQSQASGGGTFSLPGTQGPGGTGASTGIFSTENGPQALAAGQQYESNGISIDGISTTSAVWGGTSIITPSEESIDNMKVVTTGYDAENGRFSGAQIQVTSKSGTNTIHGSAFFQAWRPGLNAYQRYNGPASLQPGATPESRGLNRATGRFNQFGGSLGGPLWKNRAFAFFTYETQPNDSPLVTQGWYETPAFRSLAPAGSIAAQYLSFPGGAPAAIGQISVTCADAGLTEGVNCITVPGQGLNIGSPLKQPLGTQDLTWKGPSSPGVGGGLDPTTADIAEYTTSTPTHTSSQQYYGRADGNITNRDHLTFTIYWVPYDQTKYNGPARAYNLWHHSQINNAFAGIWNHTFSPNFLNELRANAAGWRWNEIASNPQAPFGLPQDSIGNLGSITLQNFGAPGPSLLDQWTYDYKDTATWSKHTHQIRMGGEWTRLYYLNSVAYAARPNFGFFNIWDFLNDAPQSESGMFDPHTGTPTLGRQDDRENIWGAFVQDDWKAMPSLTLNLGLRYSYFGPLYAKQNNMYSVQFGQGANWLTDMRIRQGGDLWHPQHLNFGPEFGFAYNPNFLNQRMVIRGGYGLNFNEMEIAISANVYNNPGLTFNPNFNMGSPTDTNPGIVYNTPSNVHSLYGYPPNPNTIVAFGANGLPTTGTVGVTAFRNNMPTMYTEHFSLDTETSIGAQWVLTVGYLGTVSRHTYFHYQGNAVAAAYGNPLNPQVNGVDYFDTIGHGSYNAMLVGVRHQMSRSFLIDSQFTWGRSMDNSSAPYSEQDYPYDPSLDWGRSDYDLNKQFKIYGLWQPVIFRNAHNWAEKIVGGWSLSGIFNWHTGFPWTPVYYTSASLYCNTCGYFQLMPGAYLGGAGHDMSNDAFKSGPGVGNGMNKNFPNGGLAYFTPPAWTPGPTIPATGAALPQVPGIHRNSWTGPGYRDVDATISKNFGLPYWKREGAGLEVRADAFNLFNNLNFNPTSISNNITAPNFGQATSALGSRTVTLQARFQF
jgi:hypothetical protein